MGGGWWWWWWGGVMWEWPDPQVEYKVTAGAGRHSVPSRCLRVPAFSRQSDERMRVGGAKWRLGRDTSGLTSQLGNYVSTQTHTNLDVWHQQLLFPLDDAFGGENCGFSAFFLMWFHLLSLIVVVHSPPGLAVMMEKAALLLFCCLAVTLSGSPLYPSIR